MARILPPSVFKANFEAAEFAPTQTQRVGERFATPEGLKVGVDVVDRVGGTISDAVSRFSRGRAALSRARKRERDPLGKDTGLGWLTTNAEEQAELDRQSYGAGQRTVVGAQDRDIRNKDGKIVGVRSGTDERAAGYSQMRRAWDRPGSGRLLADPSRDPSRLLSEDYKRLASSSPLPQRAKSKGRSAVQLADVRAWHKVNRPIVDDVNTAVYLRDGINNSSILDAGVDYKNLKPNEMAELLSLAGNMLVPAMDSSGAKSNTTVMVPPTKEDQDAIAIAIANNNPTRVDAIYRGLAGRAMSLIDLLDNPGLDQAETDIRKYSSLLDKWRQVSGSGGNPEEADRLQAEMMKLSGPISEANGRLRVYLGQRDRYTKAEANKLAAAKALIENDRVAKENESKARTDRLTELSSKAAGQSLSDDEHAERKALEAGGAWEAPAVSETSQGSTPTTGAVNNPSPEEAWAAALGAGKLTPGAAPAIPQGSGGMSTPDNPPPVDPAIAVRAEARSKWEADRKQNEDLTQARVDHLRRNKISEEEIGQRYPGYALETIGPSLVGRLMGDKTQTPITYDPKARGPAAGHQYQAYHRQKARQLAAKARARSNPREPTLRDQREWRDRTPTESVQSKVTGPKPLAAEKGVTFDAFDMMASKHGTESGLGERKRIYDDYKRGEYFEPNKVKFPKKKERERLKAIVIKAAKNNKVEPWLMLALVAKESGFRPTIISNSNALGIAQTIPSTFREVMGKDVDLRTVFDPETGAEAGARYLAKNIKKYAKKGRSRKVQLQMTLAAYNSGAAKLEKHGLAMLLSDRWAKVKSGTDKGKGATRLYVERILANMPKEKMPKVASQKKKS